MANKTAVVLVHGMGEQVPMETLRSFVATVWQHDLNVLRKSESRNRDPSEVFFNPDQRTGSLDLRRITTRRGENRKRVDFYELYWADLTSGSTLAVVTDWFSTLLIRKWDQVPKDVRIVWLFLWVVVIAAVIFLGGGALQKAAPDWQVWQLPPFSYAGYGAAATIVVGVLGWLIGKFAVPYLGDVARYVRATPENISVRRAIRERGLKLLEELHDPKSDYDRIIVVAHSAGTLVAYDILNHFFAKGIQRRKFAERDKVHASLGTIEQAARDLRDARKSNAQAAVMHEKTDAYRNAQRGLWDAMRRRESIETRWLVSDFVTCGSPLTHAEFLFTFDQATFEERVRESNLPTCPPQFDRANKDGFSYPDDGARFLHHAAVFAPVRWSNIYDPYAWIVLGDVISGPVKENFGLGIEDRMVRMQRPKCLLMPRLITQTLYWDEKATSEGSSPGGAPDHIKAMRSAIDLGAK